MREGQMTAYCRTWYFPYCTVRTVNTIPGFTSHSRYPNMMKGIGLSFLKVLDKLTGLYLE